MIWERFMESSYSNDGSGFQNTFHIVQMKKTSHFLTFLKFYQKKLSRWWKYSHSVCLHFHRCEILQNFRSHSATISGALLLCADTKEPEPVPSLHCGLLQPRGGGWSLTGDPLILGSNYMCFLNRLWSLHLPFYSFRDHWLTLWGPHTDGS